MSAVDNIATVDAPVYQEPADKPVDLSDHISTSTLHLDGYAIELTNNGRAVAPEVRRHNVTGKRTEWDDVLDIMLSQNRGAEALIRPIVKLGNDGAPRAVYATSKIQAARLRLPAHDMTRVRVERLDGSVDGKTGNVTFGALLVTVTPRNRR